MVRQRQDGGASDAGRRIAMLKRENQQLPELVRQFAGSSSLEEATVLGEKILANNAQSFDYGNVECTCSPTQSPTAAPTKTPNVQRAALIALHDATNGDHWKNNTNWKKPSVHECNWYGVTCDGDKVFCKLMIP